MKEIIYRIYDPMKGKENFLEETLCYRPVFTKREHDLIMLSLYDNMVFILKCKPMTLTADVTIDGKIYHKYEIVSIFDNFVSFYVDGKLLCYKGVSVNK